MSKHQAKTKKSSINASIIISTESHKKPMDTFYVKPRKVKTAAEGVAELRKQFENPELLEAQNG